MVGSIHGTFSPTLTTVFDPKTPLRAKERRWKTHFTPIVHLGHLATNIPNALITILCSYLDSTEVGSVIM